LSADENLIRKGAWLRSRDQFWNFAPLYPRNG